MNKYRARPRSELVRVVESFLNDPYWTKQVAFDIELTTDEWRTVHAALSETRANPLELPGMDDDLLAILGRSNFACAPIARLLRKAGRSIPEKAEAEQAHVIHWVLGLYLKHGAEWAEKGEAELRTHRQGT